MTYVLGFIILLGVLVFIHEFGHFIVAKIKNVMVKTFSIGFGPAIFKKKFGETEYRISIFPLGGYVAFYGDDEKDKIPKKLEHRAFKNQSVFTKMMVVFAGPFFNFILAFVLIALMYVVGKPSAASVINQVRYGSPAYKAGLVDGDKVLAIDGKTLKTWDELNKYLEEEKQESVNLKIKRNNKSLFLNTPIAKSLERNKFGEITYKNRIIGASPNKVSTLIGVEKDSTAYKLGFRTGDFIEGVNQDKVEDFKDFNNKMSQKKFLSIKVIRDGENVIISFFNNYLKNYKNFKIYKIGGVAVSYDKNYSFLNHLGIFRSDTFISSFVDDDSPAKLAGLKVGDRIVSINKNIVRSFKQLQLLVDRTGENKKDLKLLVNGENGLSLKTIQPKLTSIEHEKIGIKDERFLLGVQTTYVPGEATKYDVKIWNPIKLIYQSFVDLLMWIYLTILGFVKLITGSVSVKSLGGPVMIAKIAGDSLSLGFVYFIRIMAIISINLGIINLFPIPVLDGGHLVFYSIEALTGRPIKEKYMEHATQVGFYLLIALAIFAFYNDIAKFLGFF
jgi:regulator of sigma E protease